MTHFLRSLGTLFCVLVVGCSDTQLSEKDIDASLVQLEYAESEFRIQSYDKCIDIVDAILEKGSLLPESLLKAILMRAECYLMLGKMDDAKEDVATAEQSGEQPEKVFELKYRIAKAKNDSAGANEAYQSLLQINPNTRVQ